MVKVIDKRPTNPQDSLRRLLDGIKTPASVPHGIKVAGPNDYVSFMDSAGVSHRWDGDAIATYNTRLAEAEVAMAEANVELEAAQAELEAAKERIGAASGDLTAYIEKVEAAQAKADAVQASFEGMAGELDAVADAVEAVKARTTTVEGETGRLSGAVESALAEAASASSLASEAGDKAEAAAAEATKVQALAQNASAAAEEAERKALEAAGIAAGKGKVIYGGTAPGGADATSENLWIRSSDNRPHRWDGTRWVEVTDAAVVASAAAASAAQATADKAVSDAAKAQAAAQAAASAAKKAQGDATKAQAAASRAQALADAAKADAAQAASAAAEADRKALEAAGIAGGKGKVIYSSTAPTGADQSTSNLWIRSTDNRPHRWSGSAWVAVTDKAVTDAASAAVAAQAKADKAERDAAAAQATADQAKRDAAAAQAAAVTADGKASQAISAAQAAQGTADKAVNDAAKAQAAASAADRKALDAAGLAGSKGKVIYSATAPTGADQVGQNLWIRTTDNRPHRWSGSAWVAVTDKVATDAAASAAAANTLASQAKSAADKAQADATSAATAAQDAMRAANQAQDSANGKNTVSYTTGTPAGVGTRLGDTHYQVNAAGTVLRWWRWSGSAWVEQALDGQVISSLDAGKITAGTLDAARIRAGSITGDKINAQSVAAAVGTFVKVNAENVGVSGELAARIVTAMSAQTKNLVVTESAILQHTTLLGTTVAEQLNVTKKLVARNAIVDGTLDVAQLNVTEQMAASIVNAMSVNAKKLVVTEDAIMNQLTVIQNIVTPELIAERINVKNLGAALVTAGALQTDEAANRGVKITSTGYKAYDSAGNLTVDLNGTNNLIRGEFATDSDPKVGVKLLQKDFLAAVELYPRNKLTDSSHGAVWYDGYSRGSEQGLVIAATRNAAVQNSDPGILLKPAQGVGFQGSFARDSPALKTGILEAQSAPAGGWNDLEMKFHTPFPAGSSVAVFLSPINTNKVEVAYAIQDATTTGFKAVIKNVSTRATGYQWIKYLAIAI